MRLDTSRACPSHDPQHPVVRCDLARGHTPSDEHYAELGGVVYRWGAALEEAKPTRPPDGTDIGSSEHFLAAEIFTDGIKAAFITAQLVESGEAKCVCCEAVLAEVDAWGEVTIGTADYEEAVEKALAVAMSISHKHHTDRRRGHGYRPRKYGNLFGHDSPLLIQAPVCARCHTGPDSEIHPGPQLSRSSS